MRFIEIVMLLKFLPSLLGVEHVHNRSHFDALVSFRI